MKEIDNATAILNAEGSAPFLVGFDDDRADVDAYVTDLICVLVRNMPVTTMKDSEHGIRLLEQLREGRPDYRAEVVELEDADHAWLVAAVDTHGPLVLRLMASRVKEALEPINKSRPERREAEREAKREAKRKTKSPAKDAASEETEG